MEAEDVEKCYSTDETSNWLKSKQIKVTFTQQQLIDWQITQEELTLTMNAYG